MEVGGGPPSAPDLQQQQQQPASQASAPPAKVERLNSAVQQQLNLESVKTRALGLFKAISRILEDFDAIARTNSVPKWQDILSQFSMVNLELHNIVEDIKKVSKAFVVHPKNVHGDNASILPVMLSSKLLPEMEAEDNARRELLLAGIADLPISTQIEKLKARIDMIGSACEIAEKVIADNRKAYGLGSRQGPTLVPTLDKVQAAKIQEQENQLRAAVNFGEGLRVSVDQRHLPSSLPSHLVDVLTPGDGVQNFGDSGSFPKSTPFSSNTVNPQGGLMQIAVRKERKKIEPTSLIVVSNHDAPGKDKKITIGETKPYVRICNNTRNWKATIFQGSLNKAPGGQLVGRSVPSPSNVTVPANFDNVSTPPLPYANSPRSGANIMNTPSPQQQTQPPQQRQKMMQVPQHQQQLLAQQQLRQTSTAAILGQGSMSQLHDLQGQTQQKFQTIPNQQQMQYSQSLSQQQFQNRQLQSAHIQQNIAQNQMNQGNPLRNHLSQFTGSANNALFNAAQTSPNPQMITNMSAAMQSQSLLPRMQFGLSAGHPQRNLPTQILNDQMFGMGNANPALAMQQQQHGAQVGFGNLPVSSQNIQQTITGLPNPTQNPNFQQQRQQNQQ